MIQNIKTSRHRLIICLIGFFLGNSVWLCNHPPCHAGDPKLESSNDREELLNPTYIGDLYQIDLNMEKTNDETVKPALQSTNQMNIKSEKILATLSIPGFGVPKSFQQAIQWSENNASKDDVQAELTLGVL